MSASRLPARPEHPRLSSIGCNLFISLMLFLIFGQTSWAQRRDTQGQGGPTAPKELESFLDKLFAEQMHRLHIPGAVFVLVKDGRVFFSKGYGYADLETRRAIIPDETLFRVGSISKLFTATAVMQLWERRKLNFEDDVNRYLRTFQLKNDYPKPVTIHNLLTHTGGFGEQLIGKAARTESDLLPLGPYLAKRMPPRVMPPGEFVSYSNHGYALLGYIVELISGISFDRYVEENILKPIGMSRSSFRQPLSSNLAPKMAMGYVYKDGSYQRAPLDFLNDGPAGALITTATDMAQFMIAHLEGGRLGSARILGEVSADEMHRRHFTPHPKLPGVCYGFWEYFANNQRAIQHDGSWTGFYSLLFLLPQHRLGFFIAVNSLDLQNPSMHNFGEELTHQFLDRYYPAQQIHLLPSHLHLQTRADRFAGSYRGRIPPRHTFEKIVTLFTQSRVTSDGDGVLTMSSLFSEPTQWVQVEPLLFQQINGHDYVAFHQDANGQISHMFEPETNWRVRWYETTAFQLWLIGFLVLVFLSTLVWPAGYLWQFMGKERPPVVRLAKLCRLMAGLTGTLNFVFLLFLAFAIESYPNLIWYGVPWGVTALLVIPCVTTTLTMGLPALTWLAWRNGYWTLLHRSHYLVVTLASLTFIGFLLYWNLLGFHY